MWQGIATVVAVNVTALSLFVWAKTPSYTSDEPAPISYSIPFLGHALDFVNRHREFMNESNAISKGQPFSILIAGRKHYVFSSLADITTIYKTKTLDIKGFVILLYKACFGMTDKEATQLDSIKPIVHDVNTTYLLTAKNNAVTASKYFTLLDKVFNTIDKEIKESATRSVIKDGFEFVTDTQGTATVRAYFGQTLLDINPKILSNLGAFIQDGFFPALAGIPNFLIPKPIAARERAVEDFKEFMKIVEKDDSLTSPFLAFRMKQLKEQGIGENAHARDLFGLLFGTNANSIPTAYLALLRILYCPGLVEDIRKELQAEGYGTLPPADYITLFPTGLPLLRSVFWESVRINNIGNTIREVVEPTKLVSGDRTYNLKKWGVVTLPSCLVHMNPILHPEPDVFRPRRFLATALGGDGENHTKSLKPFGGGNSYCPGRVFAEKQVMGFLAEMCWRYDMTLLNKETFTIPDNANFENVVKCPRAMLELKMRG